MADDENPLEELYIDVDEFDRQALANFLEEYVVIDENTGEPRFLGPFDELSRKEQMTTLLLYQKAAEDLNHFDQAGQSSGDVADTLGVGTSSVSRYADDLGFIDNDSSRGGYFIIDTEIHAAIDYVQNENEE